jgi:hypothetical protein
VLIDFARKAVGPTFPGFRESLLARAAGNSPVEKPRTGELSMEDYERLKALVESAADDVAKAEGGNKAAGTRVRKIMQDIKAAAQEVRVKILEVRSAAD